MCLTALWQNHLRQICHVLLSLCNRSIHDRAFPDVAEAEGRTWKLMGSGPRQWSFKI